MQDILPFLIYGQHQFRQMHLLPFSLTELMGWPDVSLDDFGKKIPQKRESPSIDVLQCLFTGFYPRIHDKKLVPQEWLKNYSQTYLERDVREIINVEDLEAFRRFMGLCAGRSGQLLNLSSLATDCGITHTTARRWAFSIDICRRSLAATKRYKHLFLVEFLIPLIR